MTETGPENTNETTSQPASGTHEEYEDWDKQRANGTSTEPSDASSAEGDPDKPFESVGRNAGRTLAELMSPQLKAQDVGLSEDEELLLTEELGKWINADTNPYEKEEEPTA